MRSEIMRTPPMQVAMSVVRRLWYAGRDETLEIAGHRLRYVPGTRPTRPIYRDDVNETVRNNARQLEYIAFNVKRGETVIDVGANAGQCAVLLGTLVGSSGKVVAFEPDHEPRALLEENLRINHLAQIVRVEPLALFDTVGEHRFFSRPGDSMGSLERAGFGTHADLADIRESTVHTIPLDDYLVSNGLSDPDWLKIDVEGAEIHVLRGASRALHGKTKIVCELHPYAWESFETTFDELLSMVRDAGRSISWLDNTREFTGRPDYGAVVISW